MMLHERDLFAIAKLLVCLVPCAKLASHTKSVWQC